MLLPAAPARPAGLCLGSPILLEGPPGSGKSALIEHVAALTGNAQGAWGGCWGWDAGCWLGAEGSGIQRGSKPASL